MNAAGGSERSRNEADLTEIVSRPSRYLADRPEDPLGTILLAHGAGAPMDSDWMTAATAALVAARLRVIRFEFAYMAARREGRRPPPPKAEALVAEYAFVVDGFLQSLDGPLILGGKSLGGRVATMVAGTPLDPRVKAVAVFGYPFHPPAKPAATRLAPLAAARLPVLICQGSRDPFGTASDVASYELASAVRLLWHEDGDHDLSPRRKSGHRLEDHLATAAAAVARLLSP